LVPRGASQGGLNLPMPRSLSLTSNQSLQRAEGGAAPM
jgi:hypothetical protein